MIWLLLPAFSALVLFAMAFAAVYELGVRHERERAEPSRVHHYRTVGAFAGLCRDMTPEEEPQHDLRARRIDWRATLTERHRSGHESRYLFKPPPSDRPNLRVFGGQQS